MKWRRSRRVRWGLPVVVAGVVALVAASPSFGAGASPPTLPDVTLAQLLSRVEHPDVGAWHGDVHWVAELGIPDLSDLSSLTSATGGEVDWVALASGSHDVKVWSDGDNLRLALLGPSNEVDLYASRGATWYYDSVTNKATRLAAAPGAVASLSSAAATPEAIGKTLLAGALVNTDASFLPGRTIAGRPAYVISLTPDPGGPGAAATTIGRLEVAVDAATGMVLQVGLYPAGAAQPALQVGYRSVDFLPRGAHLPPSEFAFSPAPGTTVATHQVRGPSTGERTPSAPRPAAAVGGQGWAGVVTIPDAGNQVVPVTKGPHQKKGPHQQKKHGGDTLAQQLAGVTTAVSGPWGHGQLLSTRLLNALFLPDGNVLVGFVTPAALEVAAGGSAS